jgi:hypothetical protein
MTHHRTSGETGQDSGAYRDPLLDARINGEVRECRLPHQTPWTASSVVPARDPAALAAARAAVQAPSHSTTTTLIPMPLSLIVAEADNTTMPMINHISMRQNGQNQQLVDHWVELLQIRLKRIEEAENPSQLDLRLQHLGETVVLHSRLLTTERELMALESTSRRVQELRREANRGR